MVLLIPTLRGIISRDFTFIAGVPALSYYFAFFPEHYRHNYFFLSANLVGFVFAVLVAKVVFCFISGLIVSSIIRDFGNELRKLIFKRYLQFGKLFFDRHSLGFLQQVLTTYVYQVANVLGTANELIYAVTTLIVYVGVMLYISWQLTLVFLALVPILYFAYNWLVRKIHRSSHYYSESYGVLAATISNAVSCIGLVKAYTAEARESETFSHTSDHVAELEFSIDKKRLAIGPSGELIILFFLFILVAIIAYILNGHPSETAMDYLVFLLVLKRAVTTYTGINIVRAAIAGVSGPLDEIRRMLADEEKFFVPDGTREFPGLSGPLELRDLSFSFPNGAAVLKSVNIKVLPGEVAAIVGASGSGKT
ncbi:MAG TPA: ABC transporter ATP-binding protein, partial [Oligoflexia bacterium]|nr:ABC transporter ATP-binding protein [Oligoflexia bacterium]